MHARMATKKRTLSAERLRRIAVAANVDPRTVAKVLAGAPINSMARERVRKQLALEGFK